MTAQILPFKLPEQPGDSNGPTLADGDGGGGPIVIRVVLDFGDDDLEEPEPQPQPRSSWWAVLLGAVIGFSI